MLFLSLFFYLLPLVLEASAREEETDWDAGALAYGFLVSLSSSLRLFSCFAVLFPPGSKMEAMACCSSPRFLSFFLWFWKLALEKRKPIVMLVLSAMGFLFPCFSPILLCFLPVLLSVFPPVFLCSTPLLFSSFSSVPSLSVSLFCLLPCSPFPPLSVLCSSVHQSMSGIMGKKSWCRGPRFAANFLLNRLHPLKRGRR